MKNLDRNVTLLCPLCGNLYRKEYKSENAFRAGIAEYIQFYNEKRPHRLLKNRTPCQFEEAYFSNET